MSRSSQDVSSALNTLGGYGTSVETIITKEITKIITSAMCGKNIRETIEGLFGKLWKIFILFGVNYFMKNINKVGNVFSLLLRIAIYKKMDLNLKNSESVEFLLHKKIEGFLCNGAEESKVQPVNGLKMYQRKMDGKIQIEYVPYLHSSFIQERKKEAEESIKEYENKKEIYINCIGTKKKPVEKYESKNFKAAEKIIFEFFKVRQCRNSFNSQAIVIDGPPGLGKTDFLNHVAWKKLSEYIIYLNLTKDEYMKNDFDYAIDKIYSVSVSGTCVIHIDEIDKHLSHRIKIKYDELSRKIVSTEPPTSSEKTSQSTTQQISLNIVPSFEDFERKEKEAFLYKLLHLIETDKFNDGVVIILTSNNFDSIFENVDMRHFQSMKRRFLRVRFEECDLEDFIGYCRFYNDSFKITYPEKYIPEEVFMEYVKNINPSLKIPFWHIHQGMIASSFCIPELIDIINKYTPEEEPIFSLDAKPSSPPLGVFVKNVPLIKTPESKESQKEEETSNNLVSCKLCSTLTDPDSSSSCCICENKEINSGVICENCFDEDCGYCEDCGQAWCPDHWVEVSCKKCNSHLHGGEGEEYACDCARCPFCKDTIENDEIFTECACANSICKKEECVNSLKNCSTCENKMCNECIMKIPEEKCEGKDDENYKCNHCIRTERGDKEPKVMTDPTIHEILQDIPPAHINVNYLEELKEYNLGEDAYKKLTLEYVQIANRIFQCDNPINVVRAYISMISIELRGKGEEVKIYFACKLFEYSLKEEFESLFRLSKKFQNVFFDKIEEFDDTHYISTNMKYQDIISRLKIKYSFEYKEWLKEREEKQIENECESD